MTYYDTIESPVGTLFVGGSAVGGSAAGVHRVEFVREAADLARWITAIERDAGADVEDGPARRDSAAAAEVTRQLRAYFAGERATFDLPLAPRGTAFQQRVWLALRAIPHGRTTTYGAIAAAIGQPSAARAVGLAIGRNPLAIVVPCHRVIGAGGALTGYAGGLDRKRWLLAHEGGAPAQAALPALLEAS
ncbi:MAG: methylated-DNA--[protein]-cysteine S-methyltransferase [Dehalococcoidia bacterium]|nr:methylated-DNA--[protein]-cysteine S-methyltransferase [Dehalococcoidia bacterium]